MCALWIQAGKKRKADTEKDQDSADRDVEGISESAFTPSSMQGVWLFKIGAFDSQFSEETVDKESWAIRGGVTEENDSSGRCRALRDELGYGERDSSMGTAKEIQEEEIELIKTDRCR